MLIALDNPIPLVIGPHGRKRRCADYHGSTVFISIHSHKHVNTNGCSVLMNVRPVTDKKRTSLLSVLLVAHQQLELH